MPQPSDISMDGIREIMISRLDLDLSPEEIREGDSLQGDLGLDSVDLLEIAIGIEKSYKIKITQKDVGAFVSLSTLYALCRERALVATA
ncbi:acyl carrier protein [Arthrobacter sp. 2762]|jgi:acyl carrier protein